VIPKVWNKIVFYEPKTGHGLPHNPFNALITPRPIGWISTRGTDGSENLAPYSFFNGVSYDPPQVMFASTASKADRERGKDSVGNIIDTGVFCVNVVGFEMRDAMNVTSHMAPRDVDEFDLAGLEREDCATIACSRVADAPASMECKLVKVVVKWSCFLGQFCGLSKMHLVSVHAAFCVSALPKYAMSGVRLSRAV
jgi:flavin reductase (DIM6/NTAB) family NADH-FMN oxidoreductase RutF